MGVVLFQRIKKYKSKENTISVNSLKLGPKGPFLVQRIKEDL